MAVATLEAWHGRKVSPVYALLPQLREPDWKTLLLQERLGADAIWWSFPVSSLVSMLLSLAYYRWGGWRHAHMLAHDPRASAVPAEVPAQPPSPVADCAPEADAPRESPRLS